jgi:acyl-CoA synthetase (AMP-forming)/AMP-acid ligase II
VATQHPVSALVERVGTVPELLRARAQDQPDRVCYTFLADGETDEAQLSFAQADLRALAIAAAVRSAGGGPGTRALLLLPPGLDYVTAFFGCLYAGVVAVPAYPPDPFQLERTLPRLLAITRDAMPVVALTISPLLGYLGELTRQAPELAALQWLAVDAPADMAAPDGDLEPLAPDAIALLQYTSGSTSAPRGVMVSHRNLLHNSGLIHRLLRATPETRGLIWLPPYHDMGLIGGLIQPIYAGCSVILMSPLHFLEQPLRWLRAIDRFRITVSGGPNFAYDLCVRRADPELPGQLDLSSWQVAFNGAEPIRLETLQRFADVFAPSGFRGAAFLPCYGLAEATLAVSGTGGCSGSAGEEADSAVSPTVQVDREALQGNLATSPRKGTAVRLMGCGRGFPDQQIVIVDPATHMVCADGQVGEIWVAGPSVAEGYWGKPDETERTFRAHVADSDQGPFLRSGDLGFLLDGELVVTGRLKDLIIIRGQNHYPQDLELTAERADTVLRPGCSAAFLVEDSGDGGGLVLVHELRRQSGDIDVTAVAGRIREAIAREHGLQVHTVALIQAGGMPKTSSGKVQRWLCRARFMSAELPEIGRVAVAPRTSAGSTLLMSDQLISAAPGHRAPLLESYLRERIAAASGSGPGDLDREQPMLAAGLDSLAVQELKQRVETDLGLDLSLAAVLAGGSLSDVAGQLARQVGEPASTAAKRPAAPVNRATEIAGSPAAERTAPMSHGQRFIWFMQQFDPESRAYIVAMALRAVDPVDGSALRRALDTLVARHAVLRTAFPVRNGEAVQLVRPSGQAAYQEHDAHDLDEAALTQRLAHAAGRPFDLESGPLLRADRYRHPAGDVLLVSMHHIVTDFWSMTILGRELGECYTAYANGRDPVLPAPRATYLDVVEWQRFVLNDEVLGKRLARYWDEQVAGGVPPLALPMLANDCSGSRFFALPAALTRRLRWRAATEKVTLYVLLLAAFQTLLHLRTGQDDLAIGTNVAARARPEFADVIGCCTNALPIRSRAAGHDTFRALLAQTKNQVIGALEHQEYPSALLAERHGVGRRGGSLFDTMFTFNRAPDGDDLAAVATVGPPGVRRHVGSLYVENFPLPPQPSGLPLDMMMSELGDELHGVLRYRDGATGEPTADRLIERFTAILDTVAADPDRPIAELLRETTARSG